MERARTQKRKKSERSKLHPSLWHWWGLLAFLRLSCMLPYRVQVGVGRGLGALIYRAASRRRHFAEVNLQLCFPDMPAAERARLVYEHFAALGIGVMEAALCWWASDEKLGPLHEIEGIEHIERARAEGRGALLLGSHATCTELTTRMLTLHVPVNVVYKPLKNPVLRWVADTNRLKRMKNGRMLRQKQLLVAVRRLKEGDAVWYAFDQAENKGSTNGVMVPFFGEPKAMHTGPQRIAQLSGAVALPYHVQRLPRGGGYKLIIGEPLENFPSDDSLADATRVVRVIEDQVRLAPEQYSWVHPRFARRGEGLPSPYLYA